LFKIRTEFYKYLASVPFCIFHSLQFISRKSSLVQREFRPFRVSGVYGIICRQYIPYVR